MLTAMEPRQITRWEAARWARAAYELGVRVIGDFMVTGGSHGSLAAFSIITAVAPQSTPGL